MPDLKLRLDGIQRKRKLESELENLTFKQNTWSMCLRESEGDHKLESQAITVVAHRQKTKTKQRLLKMSVKWWLL